MDIHLLKNLDRASELVALLANSRRLAIMIALLDDELTVGMIATKLSISLSSVSQHLAKLREGGVIGVRRDRIRTYYTCGSPAARSLICSVANIFGWELEQLRSNTSAEMKC